MVLQKRLTAPGGSSDPPSGHYRSINTWLTTEQFFLCPFSGSWCTSSGQHGGPAHKCINLQLHQASPASVTVPSRVLRGEMHQPGLDSFSTPLPESLGSQILPWSGLPQRPLQGLIVVTQEKRLMPDLETFRKWNEEVLAGDCRMVRGRTDQEDYCFTVVAGLKVSSPNHDSGIFYATLLVIIMLLVLRDICTSDW